jgi:hypothetical protein
MSRAFTKEDDSNSSIDVGERPISPHRNLVTDKGLAHIEPNLQRRMRRWPKATPRLTAI